MKVLILFLLFSSLVVAQTETVKIAYVGGLTGNYSQCAQKSLKALKLAVKEFNQQGGLKGRKVEVLEFDSQASPVTNYKIFEEIQRKHAVAITGIHTSNDALILSELAEKNRLPMVVASATHPGVTKDKKYAVRVCFNDDMQGEQLAKYARKVLKARNVSVVVDVSDSFTSYLSESFQKTFTSLGGKIVQTHPIRTNDTKFNQIVDSLKNVNNDLLFISANALESGYLLTQMAIANMKVPVLGSDGWQNNDLILALRNLHQTNINAHFSVHWFREINLPESKSFIKNYQREYGEAPNSSDADMVLTYDAGKLLLSAMQQAKSLNGNDLIESIRKQTISGVTGKIKMREHSDPEKQVHILRIKNGELLTGK
jgi:branched-chain amino acid transport system substrate-binding protein